MPAKTSTKSTKTTTKTTVKGQRKAAPKATATAKAKAAPKARATANVTRKVKATAKTKAAPKAKATLKTKATPKVKAALKTKNAPKAKAAAKAAPKGKKTVKTKVASKAARASKKKSRAASAHKMAKNKTSAAKSHKISPNIITLVRIILAFVWLAACELLIESPATLNILTVRFAAISIQPLILAGVFFLIALTDFLDGYFARKNDAISNLGIFLDPIADKILILCGLLFLMQYGYINIWAVLIIVAREFLVSGMRMSVAEKGVVVAASGIGKTKTALTMAAVVGFFIYMGLPPLLLASTIVFWVSQILLLFAIFFTIWSGLEYFAENKKYLA